MEEKAYDKKRMVQVGVTLHFDPKDKTIIKRRSFTTSRTN